MTELKAEGNLRVVVKILFVVYILILLKTKLFGSVTILGIKDALFSEKRSVNFIPVIGLIDTFKSMQPLQFAKYIAGSLIIFVPFGWLWPLITPFEGETSIYGVLLALLTELCKLGLAVGQADVNALIFGFAGAFIGYWFYVFVRKTVNRQNGIIVFFIFFSVFTAGLAVYLLQTGGTLL